jgi:Icc protein
MSRFIIAHVTDTHLAVDQTVLDGIDTTARLQKVAESILAFGPDCIVITGDIGHDTTVEAYHEAASHFLNSRIPVLVVPGNHDTAEKVVEGFSMQKWLKPGNRLYFCRQFGKYRLICLDSGPGTIDEEQLDWLAGLGNEPGMMSLVFMHHPPVTMGCRFMDANYPLKDDGRVMDLLWKKGIATYLFCGHYHADVTKVCNGVTVTVTPSSAVQVDPKADALVLNHTDPVWRKISISETCLEHDLVWCT